MIHNCIMMNQNEFSLTQGKDSSLLPFISVFYLQDIDHVIGSVKLGTAVSPFQLQALRTCCSTL